MTWSFWNASLHVLRWNLIFSVSLHCLPKHQVWNLCCAFCARCLLHNLSSSRLSKVSQAKVAKRKCSSIWTPPLPQQKVTDIWWQFFGARKTLQRYLMTLYPQYFKSHFKKLVVQQPLCTILMMNPKSCEITSLKKGRWSLTRHVFLSVCLWLVYTVDEHRHYTNWSQQSIKSTLSKGLKTSMIKHWQRCCWKTCDFPWSKRLEQRHMQCRPRLRTPPTDVKCFNCSVPRQVIIGWRSCIEAIWLGIIWLFIVRSLMRFWGLNFPWFRCQL